MAFAGWMPNERTSAWTLDFTQVRTNSETLSFGSITIQSSRKLRQYL